MLVVVVTHQFSPLTLCWFSRVIRNVKDHEEHLDLCGGSPKHQVGKQKAESQIVWFSVLVSSHSHL